jgi:class 3 adenylate cyclase
VRGALLRFLDLGAAPGDEPDLRIRKRVTVATTFALCLASGWYAAVAIAGVRPIIFSIAALQIIALLVALLVFTRTKRLAFLAVSIVAIGLAATLTGSLVLGGVTASNGMTWVLLAPMGAVMLLGARAATPAYLGTAATVIVAALLDPILPDDLTVMGPLRVLQTVINLLVPAAIALGLVRFIDEERLVARRQSDALLLNVLPQETAERLKKGERVIADHYDEASVLFADIVNFTPLSEEKPPQEMVSLLNELFTEFDRLADGYGLEKIKTIGDAYMIVAGVPEPRDDHAQVAVEMALAMHRVVSAQPPVNGRRLEVRIGIASGPLVAGVIGERKFSYDLWGDTVNTASRMESSGIPGCVHITTETLELLDGRYPFERRDAVEVKGKGPMTTWTLDPASIQA